MTKALCSVLRKPHQKRPSLSTALKSEYKTVPSSAHYGGKGGGLICEVIFICVVVLTFLGCLEWRQPLLELLNKICLNILGQISLEAFIISLIFDMNFFYPILVFDIINITGFA